jgi:hypothetical protein
MTETIEKTIFKKNTNGDWYRIPETLKDEFIQMDEELQSLDIGTTEWLEMAATFDDRFEEYRKVE